MLARALALGQEALLPWALLLINLVSIPAGTQVLERLLVRASVSRWYALAYGLFGGLLIPLRLDLTEPLAYALALGGIWAMKTNDSWKKGAALFALAALTKETTLFITAGYVLHRLFARPWREAIGIGAAAAGPFVVWQGVLLLHLGSFGVGSGGAKATPFEWVPYNGVWRIVADPEVRAKLSESKNVGLGLTVLLVLLALALVIAALPSMWALWRSVRDILAGWRAGGTPPVEVFLLFSNAMVMPFAPFSTYREPLGIMRFVIGLVVSVLLYGAARRARRPLNYSLLWAVTLLFALSYIAA